MNNQRSMKPHESQEEAVLRAQETIGNEQQSQEDLLKPAASDKATTEDPAAALNESHQNKMEAWHNLRKMDAELAEKRKNSTLSTKD